MAKGLGSFSLELNVDVSKSKEQVEQFVKTYQTQMKRLESGVSFENFQKFADSLKEVDALLSNLKKNNSNLFQAIFGGLDRGLLQQLQNIFNTDAPVLKQLNNIQLKIDTAKTVADVQKVAVEINKIFKSIGRPEIFDPRAMYTKKDMAVYKSQLTNALGDVGKDIIKATSLSGFDINDIIPKSYEQALDNTIIKLNNKIKTIQDTKDKLNTAFNAAQSTTNTDYTKGGVDNYVELSEVQNAEVAYKNADAVLKSFTADEKQSLEYMKAEIEYFNKLAEYNRKLSKFTSSEANAKIFEKLPDDFQEQLRKENVRISNLISESSSKFLDKGKSNAYGKLLDQTKLELSTIESEKAEYQQVYDIVKKIADEKSRSVQENRKAKYNSIFYDYGSKYNQLDAEKLASHIDINNPESLDRAAKTLMSVFGNTTSDNITNSLTKAMQEIASAETVVENKATETAATVTKANEQIVQSEQAVAQAAEKVKEEITTAKQTTTDNKVVEQVNAETDALKSEASEYEILVEILKKYRDIFDNLYNKHGDISSKGFQKDIAAVNKTFDESLKKAFPEINDTALRTLKERVAMKYDKNDPQQYSLARIINESFGEIDSLKEKMVAGKKVIEDYRALLAEAEDVVGKSKTLAESKDTVTSNKSTKKTVKKWQQQYEDLRTQYRAVIGERKEFETAEVKKDSPQYLANLTEGQKILNESLEIVNKIRGNKNITDEIKAEYDAEAKSIIAKINKSLESNSLIQQRIANAKDPNNKNASWLNSEDSARKMYDAQNAKIVGREQAAMKKIEQLKANSDNNIKNAYNALTDENKNLQSNLNQANSNLAKEKENHAKTTAALVAANSELESLKKLVTETTGTTVAESKETTQAVKAKKKSKTKAKAETVTTTEEKQTTKPTTDTVGTGAVGTGGTAIDAKATVSITNAIRTASNTIKTAIDSSTQQIVAAVKNDDDNTNTKPVVENTEPDANNTAVIESISANVTNLSTALQSAINNAAQTVANAVSKNSNELASVSNSLKNMKFISDKEIKNLGYTKTQSGEVSKLKLDASKRITNEYDKLSAEAGKTVSHIGNEVQIANMRALQSGIIKVTGAVKDANGVWQGFTTNIDKSNKATLEGINANSGYAKKLQSLDKAAMELEQKRTKLTSEIKGYTDSFDGRTKDGKNIKGQLKPILDEIANADTKKLAELAKSFDAVKKGYTELQETRKKEAQAQQRELNAKAKAEEAARKAEEKKNEKISQSVINKNLAKYQTEAGTLAQTLNADVYNTKKVKDLEDRYKTAYNKVAALGASLPKDSPLNAQQAEQWRSAVAEMDKYKKELNSIIVETEKLRNIPSGKRRTMSEQELAELTASGEYRKKLVEFAQATRPVGSTGAAEIKAYNEELRQLEYTIQNSDNTLTTYKAKLSATGNELIAVAIKTEQMKQQTSEADKEAQKLSRDFNKAQKEMQKEFAAQSEKISNSPFYNNKIGQRLSGLRGQMASATTVEELEKVRAGINAINNDLGKAQDSVKNKVNGIKNSVNAAFKTVDFKKDTANLNTEQQAIVDKYTRLIDLTNQFKADGSNASMTVARSIQQLGKELTNDIKLYNEANGIINANGGRTKAAPYALNVSKADVRAAGIQNAISGTDSLATSNIVNIKLEEYINALQRLKDIQSQFKIGEVLSPEQKTQFGAAEKQVNVLAKELEKLISSVTTLREESARTAGANASLGIDDSTVVRTNELRAAMEQLARQTYSNATVSIGEFNDRLRELSFTVNDNKGSISDMRAVLSQAGNEIYLVADSTRQTTGTLANFANMVKTKFASIGSYLMASFGYYRIFSEIRKGVGYVKEIDAALTEVRKVTNETDATYKEFVQDMAKVGSVVGATTSSLVNSAADWARLGYSIQEAGELAKNTAILMNVSEFDNINDATDAMISALKAFNYEAKDSLHVVDIFNTIGNNFAISTSDLASSLTSSASALTTAGVDLEQASALLTGANTIMQDPDSVSQGLKIISLRIRGVKSELQELGEETDGILNTSKLQGKIKALTGVDILDETNSFRNIYDVLMDIADVWDELSSMEQASVIELMAGKNRSNVFTSIMKQADTVKAAYQTALDSEGSAMRENETYLDSIQGRIDIFTNSVQNLWTNAVPDWAVKKIIDLGNAIVKITDKVGLLPTVMNAFVAFNSLKGIKFQDVYQEAKIAALERERLAREALNVSEAEGAVIETESSVATEANTAALNQNTAATETAAAANNSFKATMAGIGAVAKTTLSSLLKAVPTMLAFWAATKVIGFVVSGLDKLIKTSEEVSISVSKVKDNYQQATKEIDDNKKTITDLTDEYTKLSKGVSDHGENISLTVDEYKRYQEIVKQVTNLTPAVIEGYNAEGEAIVNKNELLERSIELLEQEQKLEAKKATSGENKKDFYKDQKKKVKEQLDKNEENLKLARDKALSFLSRSGIDTKDLMDAYGFSQSEAVNVWNDFDSKEAQQVIDNFGKIREKLSEENQITFSALIADYNNILAVGQNEMQGILKAYNDNIKTTIHGTDAYWDLEDYRGLIDNFISGLEIGEDTDVQALENKVLSAVNVLSSNADTLFGTFDDLQNKLSTTDTNGISKTYQEWVDDIEGLRQAIYDDSNIGVSDKNVLFELLGIGEGYAKEYNEYNKTIISKIKTGSEEIIQAKKDAEVELATEMQWAKEYGYDFKQTKFGNVDMNDRPVLFMDEATINKNKAALESWGESLEDIYETTMTVFGGVDEFGDVDIAFTPVIKTPDGGKLLSADELYDYIDSLIGELGKGGKSWTTEDLLSLDAKGIEKDGVLIQNVIADIGETANQTSMVMHSAGEFGALAMAENNLAKFDDEITTTTWDIIQFLSGLSLADIKLASTLDFGDATISLNQLEVALAEAKAAMYEMGSADTYSTLTTAIDNYNSVLKATQEIVTDNTQVTQEYKDSLIALGIAEDDLTTAFGEENGLVVKSAGALKKLVKEAKNNQVTNVKLAKSQAMLRYHQLQKETSKLAGNYKTLTLSERNTLNAMLQEMSALQNNIARYSILEHSLLGASNAYERFAEAQELDSQNTYLEQTENMLSALAEGFNTAKIGTFAFQEAVKGLVPESVYGDLDNLNESMDSIYNYFSSGELSKYITTTFDDQGKIEKVTIELDDLKRLVSEGAGKVFTEGSTWEAFDLDPQIQTLDQFAEGLGITKEAAFALLQEMEKYDMSWLAGDNATLLDKLTSSSADYETQLYKASIAFNELDRKLIDGTISTEEYATESAKLNATMNELGNNIAHKVSRYEELGREVDNVAKELSNAQKELSKDPSSVKQITKVNELVDKYKELVSEKENLGTVSEYEVTAALDSIGDSADSASVKLDKVRQSIIGLNEESNGKLKDTLSNLGLALSEKDGHISIKVNADANIDSYTANLIDRAKNSDGETIDISVLMQGLPADKQAELEQLNELIEQQNLIEYSMEMDGEDTVQKSLNSIKTTLNNLYKLFSQGTRLHVDASGANSTINAFLEKMKAINGQTFTAKLNITETTTKVITWDENGVPNGNNYIGPGKPGNAGLNGTAHYKGTAYAGGSWGTKKSETALVGEMGQELVVDSRTGTWYTVGDTGAEFANIPRNSIIFNHKQTESLLKNGYVNSRGKAYLNGTAYAGGTGAGGVNTWTPPTGNNNNTNNSQQVANNAANAAASTAQAASDFKDIFDEFAVLLEEINESLDYMNAEVENLVKVSDKNGKLTSVIDTNKYKLKELAEGLKLYSDYANELLQLVPQQYREAAQNGAVAIERFAGDAGEKTLEAINNYRTWAQNVADLKQQMVELNQTIVELAKQKFDNINDAYERQLGLTDAIADRIQAAIKLQEDKGNIATIEYYNKLWDIEADKLDALKDRHNDLQKELDESVKAGDIQVNSETWYDMVNAIAEVDTEIDDCVSSLEEYQNAINKIHWDRFDELAKRLDYVNDDAQSLIDLLGEIDELIDYPKEQEYWFAREVGFTKKGLTTMGLYAQQLSIAEYKSKQYAEAIKDLTAQYEQGRYSQSEYLEKLSSLKKEQNESIKAYNAAKKAIVELEKQRIDAIKNGIDKEIAATEKLINKRKEEISDQKNAYEWQKTVTKKEQDIIAIERKIAAMSGDTSLSGVAERKRLEAELANARLEMAETYRDREIEDQQTALDKTLEAFKQEKEDEKEYYDKYLEDTEKVVADSLAVVKNGTADIFNTIQEVVSEYSLTITDAISAPWAEGESAITDYQKAFGQSANETYNKLIEIAEQWDKIIEKMVKVSKININSITDDAAEHIAATYQAPNTTTNNTTTGTTDSGATNDGIGVGTRVSAAGAKIYATPDGKAYNQYYGSDPVYDIIGEQDGYWQVRYHGASEGESGWFKKEDVKKFAKGTLGVKKNQIATIDELGEELVLHASNGRLAYLTKGTSVVPADITKNLMEIGSINPQEVLDRSRAAISPYSNINGSGLNVNISYGEVLHIDHFDGSNPEAVTKLISAELDKHDRRLNENLRRFAR